MMNGRNGHTFMTFVLNISEPSAPVITSISPGVESIEVNYTEPSIKNGIIREYEIAFSTTLDFKDFTHKSSAVKSVTVTSLTPYTNYFIRVRFQSF